MKKKKSTLESLKLDSFVTSLENGEMENVKGGFIKVKGRRYTYSVRWTSVDTRVDPIEASTVEKGGN